MRKHIFETEGFYHIYNRGVDRRNIFLHNDHLNRFLQSMRDFNSAEPIGSIYEHSFIKSKLELGNLVSKLVNIICYCLNPNHFHLLLEQVEDDGVSIFMHRLGLGYTKYFNLANRRSGALFQGTFKSVPITSDEQLLHLSAYINFNDRVHKLKPGRSLSSWGEYVRGEMGLCNKEIILSKFQNTEEYKNFVEESLESILDRKASLKEYELLLLE